MLKLNQAYEIRILDPRPRNEEEFQNQLAEVPNFICKELNNLYMILGADQEYSISISPPMNPDTILYSFIGISFIALFGFIVYIFMTHEKGSKANGIA